MESGSSGGQIELVLLVPLLLAILLLNLAIMEGLSGRSDELSKMKSEYDRLMTMNYTMDPASGNIYPCP